MEEQLLGHDHFCTEVSLEGHLEFFLLVKGLYESERSWTLRVTLLKVLLRDFDVFFKSSYLSQQNNIFILI